MLSLKLLDIQGLIKEQIFLIKKNIFKTELRYYYKRYRPKYVCI